MLKNGIKISLEPLLCILCIPIFYGKNYWTWQFFLNKIELYSNSKNRWSTSGAAHMNVYEVQYCGENEIIFTRVKWRKISEKIGNNYCSLCGLIRFHKIIDDWV